MHVRVQGIGVQGPGMAGWLQCAAVLREETPYLSAHTEVPAASLLPPAERRRTTLSVKLALACGLEAVEAARADARGLLSIFSSSGADSRNCHEICEALASPAREVSPTRFHNSVNNAPAGYWSIATGCTRASNVLCAHDASFAAGLIEAAVQCVSAGEPVLLVCYDSPYPEPLHAKRPIADAFGVALLLAPAMSGSGARLELRTTHAAPTLPRSPQLAACCQGIPAARALPLLERLAGAGDGEVVLEYFSPLHLAVGVSP